MPSLNSSNNVKVLISTDADTKGITKTESALKILNASSVNSAKSLAQTEHALDSVNTSSSTAERSLTGFNAVHAMTAKSAVLMGAVAGVAQTGVIALGGAIKDAATAAIGGASSFEQNRVAFETMLGSADKARTLLTQISQFAKETPFELPEVVQGSKQLLAFGFAQEQIIPTMRKLGDIASGVGVPVGQLAYVFGQVRVAGKLMGGDLMQFTNAGVPMIEGLSKVLKVSQGDVKKMVEEGKVGFKDVEQVINNMTGSGSQFGGMMEKQSHTFGGVVSNIKDGFSQMLRAAVGVTNAGDIVQGGLFDRLKTGAEKVMPKIQTLSEKIGPFMSAAINKAMLAMYDFKTIWNDPSLTSGEVATKFDIFVQTLRRMWDVLDKMLGPSLRTLWDSLTTKLLPAFESLLPFIGEVAKVAGGVLVGSLWLVINALNIAATSISWVIKALNDGNPFVWAFIGVLGTLAASLAISNGVIAFQTAMATIRGTFITTSTLIASPIIMPAIAIGAAIASLVMVYDQARKTLDAVDAANRSRESMETSNLAVQKQLQDLRAHGTPEQKARAIATGRKLGFPGFATGGFTGRGGSDEVAGVVHKGEYVIPKSQVNQNTGQPMSSNTTTYNIQQVVLSTAEAAREFLTIQDRNSVLASKGLSIARPS